MMLKLPYIMQIPKKNTCVVFREFDKTDGNGFLSCIDDFYMGGYPYKRYLDASFLSKSVDEHKMFVLCGVLPSGEIISTSAINYSSDFDGSAILMLRVVKNEYRGLGISITQSNILLDHIKNGKKVKSVYADVMTHDHKSQDSLIKNGFVLTGLRFMLYDNKLMVPKLKFSLGSKMSQAILVSNYQNNEYNIHTFCPAKHFDFIKNIYEKLNVSFTLEIFDKAKISIIPKKTVYRTYSDFTHKSTIFFIDETGSDNCDIITDITQNNLKKDHSLLCYLNLSSQNAGLAYKTLSDNGYFFTGIKPLNDNGEYLLMSNVGQNKINYNEISLSSEGEYVLNYIMKCKGELYEE